MPKRKPLIFFTIVFAVILLFAATHAGTQGIGPTLCVTEKYDLTISNSEPFPRYITGAYELPSGEVAKCYDLKGNEKYPCYLWVFTVNCIPSDLDKVASLSFFVPTSPEQPMEVVGGPDGYVVSEIGKGGPKDWGDGMYTGRVVTVPAVYDGGNEKKWTAFATKQGTTGQISTGALYAKRHWLKYMVDCDGPIGGPGTTAVEPEPDKFTYTRTFQDGNGNTKTCSMDVILGQEFDINVTEGNCSTSGPYDISTLGVSTPGHGAGFALELQPGWFTLTASPEEYCYYNKKKKKYKCVTY